MKPRPAEFFRAGDTNLFYVNNPKVACSSIKYSVVNNADTLKGKDVVDRIHGVKNYTHQDALPDNAKFFSVVREPFARLVSGYLDKIHRHTNVFVEIERFLDIKDLDSHIGATGEALSSNFLQFIESIGRLERPRRLNQHFRHQFMNLEIRDIKYDFIGSLENYAEVERYLSAQGFTNRRFAPHATDKSLKVQLESLNEARELTQEVFERDYKLLAPYLKTK